MSDLLFTWPPAKHWLAFSPLPDTVVGMTLHLVKAREQTLLLRLPEGITLEQINAAWEAQGKVWIDVWVCQGSPFVACRMIQLPKQMAIVWHVFHVNDVPFDSCAVLYGVDVANLQKVFQTP